MKFSIITPAFNCERFITNCFHSVIKQSFLDFEIIVVDDGSTDSTGTICDEWAKKDSRWKVIHQKNQGQMLSRLNALSISKGQYALFLDSDDLLEKNALETLDKAIKKYDSPDMIIFGFSSLDGKYKYQTQSPLGKTMERTYNSKEVLKLACGKEWLNSVWQKCIKIPVPNLPKSVLEKCCNMRMGEDAIQSLFYIENYKTIVFVNDFLYIYRQNDNSETHRVDLEKTKKNIVDVSKMLNYRKETAIRNGIELNGYYKTEAHYLLSYLPMIYTVESKKKNRYELYDFCIESFLSKDNDSQESIVLDCRKRNYDLIDEKGKFMKWKNAIHKKLHFLKPLLKRGKKLNISSNALGETI